jgi:hypothetical protein
VKKSLPVAVCALLVMPALPDCRRQAMSNERAATTGTAITTGKASAIPEPDKAETGVSTRLFAGIGKPRAEYDRMDEMLDSPGIVG